MKKLWGHYRHLAPYASLLLGILVFLTVAILHLPKKEIASEVMVTPEGKVAGTEKQSPEPNPSDSPSPTNYIKRAIPKSTSTPTPAPATEKPAEVKEIHTQETIVVTVTPSPEPTPVITPSPTPDTTPFQADITKETYSVDGSNYLKATVTANKAIKTCNYSIGMLSGNGNISGNVCVAQAGQSPGSPTFHSMQVTSELDEVISF